MPIVKETYDVQANNRFEVLKLLDEDRLPNEEFKEAVLTMAKEVLGKVSKKNRKPLMSENTLRLVDRRRALKALPNSSEEVQGRYREAQRAIQREGIR